MEAAPLAPVEQAFAELQRRVEELERGPNAVPPELQQRIDALKMRAHTAPVTYARSISVAPPPPAFSAVDDIDIDSPFDGKARRRRVVIAFVVLILVVFGALLGAMAYSYSPQARVILTH
jgi:hypothetical protein